MKYKEFAQRLYPIIGGASSTHAFTKTLFDAIVIDDGKEVLEEVSNETYKAYYNGNTSISRMAKKISPYVDQEEFVEFCNEFPDGVTERLCESFQEFCPNINAHNTGEKLAALFKQIISEAATAKRKSASKGKSETIEAEVVDDETTSGAASESKKITVIQQQINVIQNGENNFNLTV